MRYSFVLILSLTLLTSCMALPEPDIDLRIQSLESQVSTLQKENAKLTEENEALRTSGSVPDFSQAKSTDFALPKGMTFEETSNKECFQKAADHFIEAGNTQCRQAGHSDADIKAKKCKLSQEIISVLVAKKNTEELACGTMH